MCGRYILRHAEIAERYLQVHGTPWSPSFNMAPSQQVPVVRVRAGTRLGETLRWGLIPYFAKGKPPKFATINARSETITTAAVLSSWYMSGRCNIGRTMTPMKRRKVFRDRVAASVADLPQDVRERVLRVFETPATSAQLGEIQQVIGRYRLGREGRSPGDTSAIYRRARFANG